MANFWGLQISGNETTAVRIFIEIWTQMCFGYSFTQKRTSMKSLFLMIRPEYIVVLHDIEN